MKTVRVRFELGGIAPPRESESAGSAREGSRGRACCRTSGTCVFVALVGVPDSVALPWAAVARTAGGARSGVLSAAAVPRAARPV